MLIVILFVVFVVFWFWKLVFFDLFGVVGLVVGGVVDELSGEVSIEWMMFGVMLKVGRGVVGD